jgi:hypothetical protein
MSPLLGSLGRPVPADGPLTAQGNPRAIFRRAIERGNLLAAELTVREIGHISLHESLALTALIAQKDPGRRSRVAAHWLLRLREQHKAATIEKPRSPRQLLPLWVALPMRTPTPR